MLAEVRKFLKECHFDAMTFPLTVGPASLLGGKSLVWKVPMPWRAKYQRFLGECVDAPWWQGMNGDEMSEIMDQLMRAKIVLFDGVQSNFVMDPEFARHIGHLSEYAPL